MPPKSLLSIIIIIIIIIIIHLYAIPVRTSEHNNCVHVGPIAFMKPIIITHDIVCDAGTHV